MATFKEAFAAARKEKGAGKTFTWNGKSYTTDRADDKKPAPTASNKPKAKPAGLNPVRNPNATSVVGKVKPKPSEPPAKKVNMPQRPVTPTRDSSVTGRYSKYETARLGNYTKAQYDAMTRSQREAKGLPVSYIDYVRSGGSSAVKKTPRPASARK